jgi:hypothetical protein
MSNLTPLRLLTETPNFDVQYLVEEANKEGEQNLYIYGPYLQAEAKNKNNRVYTLEEMTNEVGRYKKEMIATKRSLGELNHPSSAEVNPERACHMITELNQQGTTFVGKSKILRTPTGNIVRSLIQDGVKLGVSSRALGKLVKESNKGVDTVKNMRLCAVDVVHDPSVDKAFVQGILESKQFVLRDDGTIEEFYDELEKSLSHLPKKDVNSYIKEQVLAFLSKLQNV